jgi:hypothetical protein
MNCRQIKHSDKVSWITSYIKRPHEKVRVAPSGRAGRIRIESAQFGQQGQGQPDDGNAKGRDLLGYAIPVVVGRSW